jgi:hypothetical protein
MIGNMMRKILAQLSLLLIVVLSGCTGDATSDGSVRDRQDGALKDPFGYGPADHSTKTPPKEPGPFEKGSVKSDWDRFWNP